MKTINGPFCHMVGRSIGFEQGCIALLFSEDMKALIETYEEINQRNGLSQYGKDYYEGIKSMYEFMESMDHE